MPDEGFEVMDCEPKPIAKTLSFVFHTPDCAVWGHFSSNREFHSRYRLEAERQ